MLKKKRKIVRTSFEDIALMPYTSIFIVRELLVELGVNN